MSNLMTSVRVAGFEHVIGVADRAKMLREAGLFAPKASKDIRHAFMIGAMAGYYRKNGKELIGRPLNEAQAYAMAEKVLKTKVADRSSHQSSAYSAATSAKDHLRKAAGLKPSTRKGAGKGAGKGGSPAAPAIPTFTETAEVRRWATDGAAVINAILDANKTDVIPPSHRKILAKIVADLKKIGE